jgi:hypothetical protein
MHIDHHDRRPFIEKLGRARMIGVAAAIVPTTLTLVLAAPLLGGRFGSSETGLAVQLGNQLDPSSSATFQLT